jgi:lipopolysaccharide cholinephosphotransferase
MNETAIGRQLQLTELGIFKEFQRICERHSLTYYLLGGSLLGAVRHGGFIPWDDDIDVGMPRPNYERFASLCDTELGSQFAWQTYRTEPRYPFIFGKLLRNDTLLHDRITQHLPIRHCVSIDVFALDGIPRRAVSRGLHKWTIKLCKLKLGSGMRSRGPKRALAMATRVIPRAWAIAVCEMLARRFPYDDSQIVANLGGAYGYRREAVPKEWLGEGAKLQFEDVKAFGPKEWDKYLTHIYGDYMRLPPEGKRKSDHDLTSVSLGPVLDEH